MEDCYYDNTWTDEACFQLIKQGYFHLEGHIRNEIVRKGGLKKNKNGEEVLHLPLEVNTVQNIYSNIVVELLKYGKELKHGGMILKTKTGVNLVLCITAPCKEEKVSPVKMPKVIKEGEVEENK